MGYRQTLMTTAQYKALKTAQHKMALEGLSSLLRLALDGNEDALDAIDETWPGEETGVKRDRRTKIRDDVARELHAMVPAQPHRGPRPTVLGISVLLGE